MPSGPEFGVALRRAECCRVADDDQADDSLRAAVGRWVAARVVWCFKLKINGTYIVLEINIHDQNDGALTTPQPFPHVLIYISTLSEHCPFG